MSKFLDYWTKKRAARRCSFSLFLEPSNPVSDLTRCLELELHQARSAKSSGDALNDHW
jgi:hypothetical protein